MDQAKKVYGIDLGTTYSAIAYVDEHGVPVTLKNTLDDNQSVLPSVVYIEDGGNVVVGSEAKKNSVLEPERTFTEIKRFMGREDYVPRTVDGMLCEPEFISSLILKKMVEYAKGSDETVEDVVITVPAYFGDSQREATRKAGVIAGLNVLNILNEPTAAAICYGADTEKGDQTALIFDLGGGTFDVTIIQIVDSSVRVIMTGGDAELGGRRWDQAIVDYVCQQFEEMNGISLNSDENRDALQDVWIRSEEAKKTLTNRNSTAISVSCGAKMKVDISRQLFEDITSALCTRTIQLSKSLLERAKAEKGVSSIDSILLVGGSTRMPHIAAAVLSEFGIEPKLYDPDEAVAKGAALMARKSALEITVASVLEESGTDAASATPAQMDKAVEQAAQLFGLPSRQVVRELETKIVNVLPHSIGIITVDQENDRDVVSIMLHDQTEIPCTVSQTFSTLVANQSNADIKVVENDSDVTDPLNIAAWKQLNEDGNELPLPPQLPANAPVEVQFTIDAKDGKLRVFAKDLTGGNSIEFDIHLKGVMSEEDVQKAKSRARSLSVS